MRIESLTNSRIKRLVRLRNRRARDLDRVFLVEGYRELVRASEGGIAIDELFVSREHFLGDNEPALIETIAATGADVVEVGPEAFEKASYRERPEGLLAVARQFPTDLAGLPEAPDLVLVVEAIEKPGNLGTMLRTADAAGVDALIVADPTTDVFNPNVVRASLGSLFLVPVAVGATSDVLGVLTSHGLQIVASTPAASALYTHADYRSPTAFAVGSEQYGLSEEFLDRAELEVRIPMAGSLDSLNAAMAAGILLYEAIRQRSNQTADTQQG